MQFSKSMIGTKPEYERPLSSVILVPSRSLARVSSSVTYLCTRHKSSTVVDLFSIDIALAYYEVVLECAGY